MIWIKAAPVPNTTFQCGRQVSGFNRRPPLGYQCIVIIRSPPIIPTRPPTHYTITLLPPHTPQTRLKAWKFGRKNASGAKTVNARVFNPEFGSAGPLQGSAKNHILITANIIFSLSSSSFYSGPHEHKSKSKALLSWMFISRPPCTASHSSSL